MTSFSDLEQDMVDLEQELLSDQIITVHRNDTAGSAIDPVTLKRVVVEQSENCTANSGEVTRVQLQEGGAYVSRKTFIVRAADLTFTPSRKNTIVENAGDGAEWTVITVTPQLNGLSFEILAQRIV